MMLSIRSRRAFLLAAAVGLGLLAAGCEKKDSPAPHAAAATLADPRDGQTYKTAVIGGQTWMAQNLNYQTESGSWCYGNSAGNCKKYGRLYDWKTAKTVCPAGYHLPSRQEWDGLGQAAGGGREQNIQGNISWDGAGKKLKSRGGWNNNGNGTDDYGFSALPGGGRYVAGYFYGGYFYFAGNSGRWWTAADYFSGHAYSRAIYDINDNLVENGVDKDNGYSVRCVMGAAAEKSEQETVSEKTEQPEDDYNLEDSNADALPAVADCSENPEQFTDGRDGQKYKTAVIGGQTWMAANLNYQTQSGSWCYRDDISYCDRYGRLYDWNTATTVCPAGWHLPSRQEWDNLGQAAGGERKPDIRGNIDWYGAGKKLKARCGWKDNNKGQSGNGTDDYGFSSLPGGRRNNNDRFGRFSDAGGLGYWWTAAERVRSAAYDLYLSQRRRDRRYPPERVGSHAHNRWMGYDGDYFNEFDNEKDFGFSVRCVKDK